MWPFIKGEHPTKAISFTNSTGGSYYLPETPDFWVETLLMEKVKEYHEANGGAKGAAQEESVLSGKRILAFKEVYVEGFIWI